MKRPYPRILIGAPSSGSGKTTVVCGLLKALLLKKMDCVSFKCGPDYIDPMFHKYVLGVSGGNLDSFFLEPDKLHDLFLQKASADGITVIEGVMGYYDGLGGISTAASTYEIACMTDSPVILVIDGKGASLSLAATIKGFLEYKKDSGICGVILNRVSSAMAIRLTPIIEELGIQMLGYLPDHDIFRLESRHLGLLIPEEIKDLNLRLSLAAEQMGQTVDIEKICQLARSASAMEVCQRGEERLPEPIHVRIGVARDEAFCFYYQENLELLERLGAELVYFSPLRDGGMPDNLEGLLLGGGYPEAYGEKLSRNRGMIDSIYKAICGGMPVLAECGGFLYLQEELEGADGKTYPMAGVIHGKGYRTKTLSRFGYIEIENREKLPFLEPGQRIKAHEFHYWDTTLNGRSFLARKPVGERQWECIHGIDGMIAGFPHLYYLSNPEAIAGWLRWCRDCKKG